MQSKVRTPWNTESDDLYCGRQVIVYLTDTIMVPMTDFSPSSVLAFDRSAVLHGQIRRLITFILIPPDSNILFILFSL